MKLGVLGAHGMLGQAVVAHLRSLGLPHLAAGRQEVDITAHDAVRTFAGDHSLSHLLNCAAFAKVDACEEPAAQAEADAVNGLAPGLVAAAAQALAIPCLHVSSDYVFAGDAQVPYDEDATCAPLGAYGRSKHLGEQRFWAALGPQPTAAAYLVRTSWLFGHGGPNFVATMLRLFAQRAEVRVVADQFGRPTYCNDLAAALVQLLCRPAAAGTYHFANLGSTSWHGFAAAILAGARHLGLPLRCTAVQPIGSEEYPTPARRPAFSVLWTEKITAALGDEPATWQTALSRYLMQESETVVPTTSAARA